MIILERNDVRMIRWVCNAKARNRISADELKTRVKSTGMKIYLQDRRLPWFGHLETVEESTWSIKCKTFTSKVSGNSLEEDRGIHGMR